MFQLEKIRKNHSNAVNQLTALLESGKITRREYDQIYPSLNDVRYNLCGTNGDEDNGKVVGQFIESWINGSNADTEGFIQHITKNAHRYLQGEIFVMVVHYIKEYAKMASESPNRHFDGRNSFIAKYVEEIVKNCSYFK